MFGNRGSGGAMVSDSLSIRLLSLSSLIRVVERRVAVGPDGLQLARVPRLKDIKRMYPVRVEGMREARTYAEMLPVLKALRNALEDARRLGLQPVRDDGGMIYVYMDNDEMSELVIVNCDDGFQVASLKDEWSGRSYRTADGWDFVPAEEWDAEWGGLIEASDLRALIKLVEMVCF